MSSNLIPQKSDVFWKNLINSEIKHNFNTFALQMYFTVLLDDYQSELKSEEETIDRLYDLANKFPLGFSKEFDSTISIFKKNTLRSLEEVIQLIELGNFIVITGVDELLKKLPKGNWIGVTMPYFMTKEKGMYNSEQLFVQDLTDYTDYVEIKSYKKDQVEDILADRYENGFTYLLLPALSEVAANYATEVLTSEDLYKTPIIGFQGGGHIDEILNMVKPYTYNGREGSIHDDCAVALHIKMKDGLFPRVEILNIFEPNENTPVLTFDEEGFLIKYCYVNGEKRLFSEYMIENNMTDRWPLISDYNGAFLNISIFKIDEENEVVMLAAPAVKGRKYKFAKPFDNYMLEFQKQFDKIDKENIALSFNCMWNYLFGELEGKKLELGGPMTYGEIAYRLVNQTMVYLKIDKINS